MKRWLTLFAVVALVGGAAYGLTRVLWPAAPVNEDQVTWLAREFKLSAEQKVAVEKLHHAYLPVCSDHCAAIVDVRERLSLTPQDAALHAELARLERECQQATLAHVRQVAACMDAKQGQRFLSLVEPRILHHDHHAAFGLK